MRQGTAACRGFGLAILRKRLFLHRQSSPRTGYIQGRFLAASVWYAHFERFVRRSSQRTLFLKLCGLRGLCVRLFGELTHPGFGSPLANCVIPLPMVAPLPPFISLRPLRSLRLKITLRTSRTLREAFSATPRLRVRIFFGGRGLPRAGLSKVFGGALDKAASSRRTPRNVTLSVFSFRTSYSFSLAAVLGASVLFSRRFGLFVRTFQNPFPLKST